MTAGVQPSGLRSKAQASQLRLIQCSKDLRVGRRPVEKSIRDERSCSERIDFSPAAGRSSDRLSFCRHLACAIAQLHAPLCLPCLRGCGVGGCALFAVICGQSGWVGGNPNSEFRIPNFALCASVVCRSIRFTLEAGRCRLPRELGARQSLRLDRTHPATRSAELAANLNTHRRREVHPVAGRGKGHGPFGLRLRP